MSSAPRPEPLLTPPWPRPLARLAALAAPPTTLRLRGELEPADARRVAIVGTRGASAPGLRFARTLAAELARDGLIIVSGGARGIDRAAHEGALAAGGRTWAVLPTGFRPPYPASHRGLFGRVLESGGALLSELDDGTPAAPFRFLQRNRLIAALADVVLVVEAPSRSGALNTVEHASALGVPVLVAPVPPHEERLLGSLALLAAGHGACVDADGVRRALGLPLRRQLTFAESKPARGGRSRRPHTPRVIAQIDAQTEDPDERAILRAVRNTPLPYELLLAESGVEEAALETALGALEDRGLLGYTDGRYRLTI